MSDDIVDNILTDLDFKSLYILAEYYDKQATIIRSRAIKLQQHSDMQNRSIMQLEFIRNTPKVVMRYLKQGHSAERACKLAADHTGVLLETVVHRWKEFLASNSHENIKKRDALVYELHALGLSNVNIADRVDVHPVTISRILKKKREKSLYVKNKNRLHLFYEGGKEKIKKPRKSKKIKKMQPTISQQAANNDFIKDNPEYAT